MAHKKILVLNPRRKDMQKQFDSALKELNEEIHKGNDCDIALETLTGKNITIVEGYIDNEVTDEGKLEAMPCKWFNKQVLDELKIKYRK